MDGAEFHGDDRFSLSRASFAGSSHLAFPRCGSCQVTLVTDPLAGKWPYGGSPSWLPAFSYQDWLTEVPLLEHKSKQTWRSKIKELRAAAVEVGRPEFLLANNEYGLGKATAFATSPTGGNFTRFSKSMVCRTPRCSVHHLPAVQSPVHTCFGAMHPTD